MSCTGEQNSIGCCNNACLRRPAVGRSQHVDEFRLERQSPGGRQRDTKHVRYCRTYLREDAMSKAVLQCSAVLIAFLSDGATAQPQTQETAIPNLASADF